MKNKKWVALLKDCVLCLLGAIAGIAIYETYLSRANKTVIFWGTTIVLVIIILVIIIHVLNRIFGWYIPSSEHKTAREAYAEYLERKEKEKIEKQERKT